MHQDLITWFFNENGIDKESTPSAASIEHFLIKLFLEDVPMQNAMNEAFKKNLPDRDAAIEAEQKEIEAAVSGEQIIKIMRRGADMMNQQLLMRRALEFEDEIVPVIMRMLKTSLNDIFIEVSCRVLAVCSKDVSEDLIAMYDDVRGAFAQSMILVALGFKAAQTRIPWLIKKFNELKSVYPSENFCYGAFYALYEMETRFYADSAKFSTP